jgi:hypothetical protein
MLASKLMEDSMTFLKSVKKATLGRVKRAIREVWHNRASERLVKLPSYAVYREIQMTGNKKKLAKVFAREANIAYLARYATRTIGSKLRVLCHGSRNGAEVRWFRKYLTDAATVLGTDISDTASQFPDMIQWDFHDLKNEWIGAWDVIYTNSWDHAFDPDQAFHTWMSCLSERGHLFLEHSRLHTPAYASALDPFGATLAALHTKLDKIGEPNWSVTHIIDDLPEKGDQLRVVVVGRTPMRSAA